MDRTYKTEFTEFDVSTLPAIPATWRDISWHNDACPSWRTPNGWHVFVDFANPAEREVENASRFSAIHDDLGTNFDTDSWGELLVGLVARSFASAVRHDLADNLAEIIRRNKTERYSHGACATQDFTDANMIMAEAFEFIAGHDVDGDSDSDCDLWNTAWDMARKSDFSI